MRPMLTEADFESAQADGALVYITDKANGPSLHRLPCSHVKPEYFKRKVIEFHGKNGGYWRVEDDEADPRLEAARQCGLCQPMAPKQERTQAHAELRTSPASEPVRAGQLNGETFGDTAVALRWLGEPRKGFEAWCSKQLDLQAKPPDPRGRLRELIRGAIRQVSGAPESILRASFHASSLLPRSDVENVLFTNVDATGSCFGHLAGRGVEFEFREEDPSGRAPRVALPCCSIYELVNAARSLDVWTQRGVLATWTSIPIPDLRTVTRAAPLWWYLRRAPLELASSGPLRGHFGVDLAVHVPVGTRLNAAATVKLAVDAVVLGLSCDNGQSPDDGIRAMSGFAGAPEQEVRRLLSDDSRALFGAHRLVDRRGQVSPPDAGCVLGRLLVRESDNASWQISGRILDLS